MPEPVVYALADRPEVEVLVDGAWRPGQLRMWKPQDDGTWIANVMWSAGPAQNRLDDFTHDRVRRLQEASDPRHP